MRQVVDPFMPLRQRTAVPHRRKPQPPRGPGTSLDGMRRTQGRPAPAASPHALTQGPQWIAPREPLPPRAAPRTGIPAVRPPTAVSPPPQERRQAGRLRRAASHLQTPGIIAAGLAAGLAAQSQLLGELVVAGYGVFALIRHVRSRTTFLFALCMFIGIIVLLIVTSNNRLAANFAVYAFLLLGIGAVTLGVELYRGEA